jgi:hypothetical protein
VQWLKGDSGIREASRNGYRNLGPVVVTKDGIKLTLDNIYFDEDRLRLSAVAEGNVIEDENFKSQMEASVQINPASGKPVKEEISSSTIPRRVQPYIMVTFADFKDPGGSQESRGFDGKKFEILAEKVFRPGEVKEFLAKDEIQGIQLNVKVYKENEWTTDFGTITIPFDKKDILMSKVFPQQEEIKVEHGTIGVDKLTLSPTRIRLDVSFDMDKGYFFSGFENPELWDGEGNIYKPEGLISTDWDEKTRSIYMVPSIYFEKLPEKLYFSFSGIRIGSEEGRTFEVRPDESFPRKLSYMGHDITLKNVEYKDGQLGISCIVSDSKLLNIQGLELCGDGSNEKSIIYSESSSNEDENTNWFRTLFKVDKKDSYRLKFEYPGLLINTPSSCGLKIDN